MIGGKYKNIVLVGMIIGGFLLFMAFSSVWVVDKIEKNRSCVKTCDIPLAKEVDKKREK